MNLSKSIFYAVMAIWYNFQIDRLCYKKERHNEKVEILREKIEKMAKRCHDFIEQDIKDKESNDNL